MSVASVSRLLNDNVGCSEDVKTNSVTEMEIVSNQTLLASLLPLPQLQSSSLSAVCPPSDQIYLQAAAVFQQLHTEKPVTHQGLHYGKKTDTPPPESGGKPAQKQAYQLAFNTLKYQDLLEDMITDSCFHTSQQISSDLLPLAMVMLFDFQDRRFLLCERSTKEEQEAVQEVRDLEKSLQRCKTKLAASLARYRVKQSLQSVSCFLSDSVRTKQHRAKSLPLYAWINTLQTSLEEVCEALQSSGLCEVKNMTDLKESTFCMDPLCPDTLVFSHRLRSRLQNSGLSSTHILNIQDRTVCVAVSVLRPLLFDKGDVLVAGSFSAMTTAHIAVAAAARSGRVLLCGADHKPSQVEEIKKLLTHMDVKNVRILSEAFCSLKEFDAVVQRLKVIIVLPQCSSSALNDPLTTIHSEHGDWDLLPDLSHGSVSKNKIHSLSFRQARLLGHALSFPKVQTVVYCTRSVYPEENEHLVKRVLEKTHTHPKLLPFRVNGPIFPDDSSSGDATDSKFFWLKASQFTNGCFIARLSRQADPTKVETVQDVLARAAAKGLLGGIIPEQSKTGRKRKVKKNRAASATSKSSSPSGEETGGEFVNGEDAVEPSEYEEGKGGEEFKDSEEQGEKVGDKEEEKGEKKRRRKRTVKRHPKLTKKTPTASKPKSHKLKTTKRRENQSHLKRRQTKSKQRRIPRLTLTLISSAKPSNHLSPITALAHKLSVTPAIKSQQTVLDSPPPAGKHPPPAHRGPAPPHTASKRQNTQPERAAKTEMNSTKPAKKAVRSETEAVKQAADFVLPPISLPSSSSKRSKSGSSESQLPSRTSNMSASSVSLPGL
ncbi:putative methyltransferase NSUN7 [Acanthochromis polyacanthus]|uniref:putative methyltransferase NSUN7 n=1 Tax=Acanthochromis polyacanthus TaxID=80966 RepID=UPI002234589F|nr:putative methyltransferase NSUN7 [Acanthochromis polyacanthus]